MAYAEEARILISKAREKSRQEDLRLNAMALDLVEGMIFFGDESIEPSRISPHSRSRG